MRWGRHTTSGLPRSQCMDDMDYLIYAIRKKDKMTANLLLLWASLDNRDLWYGLFTAASIESSVCAKKLSEWVGDIASNELEFIKAIRLLRNYSLIEDVQDVASYATHPVVHRWAYHFPGEDIRMELAQLAVIIVASAVPDTSTRDYWTMRRRLLPYAQVSSRWILVGEMGRRSRAHDTDNLDFDENEEKVAMLDIIHNLGNLFMDQGKLAEAEKIYEQTLQGTEQALGLSHISTLKNVSNLGLLYCKQDKLAEAENLYKRALLGIEVPRPNHKLMLDAIHNLGFLYWKQGKLDEAEKMFERALRGREKALGLSHIKTLDTVNNLGILYFCQDKFAEAEKMLERALQGYEETLGLGNIGTYRPALDTMMNRGRLYEKQGNFAKAREEYSRALLGFQTIFGSSHSECQRIEHDIEFIDSILGKSRYSTNLLTRELIS